MRGIMTCKEGRWGGRDKGVGREKRLKGWRREERVVPLESVNPQWQDLIAVWSPTTFPRRL